MPVPDLSLEGKTWRKPLVIQDRRLDAVVMCTQASRGFAGREVPLQLDGESRTGSVNRRQLETSPSIGKAAGVRDARGPKWIEGLRLNPPERNFSK